MKKKGYYINGYWVPSMTQKDARKVIKQHKKDFQEQVEKVIAEFEIILKIYDLMKNYIKDTDQQLIFNMADKSRGEALASIEKVKNEIKEAKKNEIKYAEVIKYYLFFNLSWQYNQRFFNNELLNYCHLMEKEYIKNKWNK